MPSYLITGVSRGLGWEFLNQLSTDANNTVIGIVRNKPVTDKKIAEAFAERSNITILEADLTSYDDLKRASSDVATVTGGSLDYLIANGAYITPFDAYDGLGTLIDKPQQLSTEYHKMMDTNVLGNIYLFGVFIPLILKGKGRKVMTVTSGFGDIDWTNELDLDMNALYSISKAAVNMVTAKFNAQYKKDNVLFVSICPGFADVDHPQEPPNEAQQAKLQEMFATITKYSPSFKGPDSPALTVNTLLSVMDDCSIEKDDGGKVWSHFKNKRWL
ncbi:NAD(P)-binding protein [Apiospora marii]|uniref:NAD(P)-binding protein n=1 Tax=Apiospora marii TaxID=335849 RepID=UPI00312E01BF